MAEWQVEVLSRLRLRNQPGPLEETIKNCRYRAEFGFSRTPDGLFAVDNELWLKWEYLQKDCTQLEYERNRLQRVSPDNISATLISFLFHGGLI